ncbi:MAG TPA: arsenic efflux protein [Candidatus Stercorousia faecigallinarum]|nr:arsenic efflux protein [Candidatus Stercorousia faecigallinarum]
MLIDILNKINSINENLFSGFDALIEGLGMPEWLADAIIDSFHILPLLFIVFFIIELIEYFYADKINSFMKKSEKAAPLIGSLAAIIPQCGFSVIASTLYIRKFITKGTLIAIYLATSDEAIPILLANPTHIHYVVPVICIKIVIAVLAGYLIDFVLKDNKYIPIIQEADNEEDEGCCHHSVSKRRKRELICHPLKHTFNIFIFILIITIILNFAIAVYAEHAVLHILLGKVKILEPVITAFIGLIPNCAVSIALTMLLIKGSISFGAVMSGLLSNAGLGILVLFRHNENIKDAMKVTGLLLLISIAAGMIIQLF